MIIKILKGRGIRGCLDYASGKGTDSQLVGGNLLSTTPREIACEFGIIRSLVPRVKLAARHIIVSLDEDDPRLDPTKLLLLSRQVVTGLGFELAPWMSYLHHDGHTQHLHIITTPIKMDGSRVKEWQDYRKAKELQGVLEEHWNLTLSPQVRLDDPRLPTLGRYGLGVEKDGTPKLPAAGLVKAGHLTEEERLRIPAGRFSTPQFATRSSAQGEPGKRELIKMAMESLLPSAGTLGHLQLGLKAWGISLVADLEKGRVKFVIGGSKGVIFASKIDPRYTLTGLQKLGLTIHEWPRSSNPIQQLQPPLEPKLPAAGKYHLDMGPARIVQVISPKLPWRETSSIPVPGRLQMGPPRQNFIVKAMPLPDRTKELAESLRRTQWDAAAAAHARLSRDLSPILEIPELEPSTDDLLPMPELPSPGEYALGPSANDLLPSPGKHKLTLQQGCQPPPGKFGLITKAESPDLPHHHLGFTFRRKLG